LGKFQRCIGNKNSHWYSLNYTLDFVHAYTGLNKWAHVMSLAGHEDSGTVVETLDADLTDFLQKLLQTKDELVLFIMGDHGMRYGEWFKVLDGSHEHKLPMLLTVVSTSLLRDIPNSADTLDHNTLRLVSKLDLHNTAKYLGDVPYYRGYSSKDWSTETGNSLFISKIPNFRTCDSIKIPPYFCSCLKFYDLPKDIYTSPSSQEDKNTSALVNYFANRMLQQINDDSYTSFHSEMGHICRKLSLNRIESVQWQYLDRSRHFYKFVLSVNEHKFARFEGVMLISATYMRPRCLEQGYGVIPMYESGRRQYRVMYVKRQDAYAGLCEDMCRLKLISAPLCICDKLEKIAYKEPYLLEVLRLGYEIGLGKEAESCEEFCEGKGLLCEEKGINASNLCREMEKMTECGGCYEAENQLAYPGVRAGDCFVSRADRFSCSAKEAGIARVCACVEATVSTL